MRDERLEVSVTFDERHGYVASAPELRSAVVALGVNKASGFSCETAGGPRSPVVSCPDTSS